MLEPGPQTPPDQPDDSAAPSRSLGASAGSTVRAGLADGGLVIDVDSEGLDQSRVHPQARATSWLLVGTLENGAEFPPGHLTEHMAAATRSWCSSASRTGAVAYRLEDAARVDALACAAIARAACELALR